MEHGISTGGGPLPLTFLVLNILSLRKQRKGSFTTKRNERLPQIISWVNRTEVTNRCGDKDEPLYREPSPGFAMEFPGKCLACLIRGSIAATATALHCQCQHK
ncbi:hypothetical protein J6590_009912 [Homalodisca vitripennis]|nr:hypothetical protein J6590_009912 [Homalodisca vitripennis]